MSSDDEDSAAGSKSAANTGKTNKGSCNNNNTDAVPMDIDMTDIVRNYRQEQEEAQLKKKKELVDVHKSQTSTEKRLFLWGTYIDLYIIFVSLFFPTARTWQRQSWSVRIVPIASLLRRLRMMIIPLCRCRR